MSLADAVSHPERVLIVDDEPTAVHALAAILSHYPERYFACSATEALPAALRYRPHVIILDAQLTDGDGFEVCRQIRAHPELAEVPIIFATAHAAADIQTRAFDVGASDFICKPVVPELLRARVRLHMRHRRGFKRQAARRDLSVSAPRTRPWILIIDDDAADVALLSRSLHSLGEVSVAHDAHAGIAMAREMQPDLVVLDVRLPDLDGFEVCATLKSEPALAHVPIVFVTHRADTPSEARALDLGAADFVSKPFHDRVIRARMRNILALKISHDDAMRAAMDRWRMLSDSRVADVLKHVRDGILTLNGQGRIVLANPAACELLERSESTLMGQAAELFLSIGPSDDQQQPFHAVLWNAEPREVEVSVSYTGAGADRLTTVVMRDTRWQRAFAREEKLRAEAEEDSREKRQALAFLAHELGNPLNGVLGITELLRRDAATLSETKLSARLDMLAECGGQMRRLLRDFLDLSALEAGAMAVDPVVTDAWACVEKAVELHATIGSTRAIQVAQCRPDMAVRVWADPQRLTQVLHNLLSNAVKYNRDGGWVALYAQHEGGSWRLSVEDNGPGMSPQQLAALGQPFQRAGREASAIPGSGLGLYFTRRLTEAMGGTMEICSMSGKGTRCDVLLRAAEPLSEESQRTRT